nr:restriction endonuclease subunit S [Dyella soli]
MPRADMEEVLDFDFHLPPVAEQRRIVAALDKAFAGIATAKANAERNLKLAGELINQGYRHIAEGQGRRHWERLRVADVAAAKKGSIRTGPFGSQLLHSEFVDAGIAVLGIDNAVNNEFQWGKRRYVTPAKFEQLARYRVYPGDVLITIMGTCGRCAVVPDNIPVAINTKHLCCISLDNNKCLPSFLHTYFLYDPSAREYLQQQAKGSVMDGLNMGLIIDLPLLLPPVEVQQAVVDNFRALREGINLFIEAQSSKLTALDALKQSLLTEAFAGKL